MLCPSCAHKLKRNELVMCARCWALVPAATRERIARLYMTDNSSDEFMDTVASAARSIKVVD